MNQLIQQLLELLQSLQPAAGTAASALSDLLIAQAILSIQQDPSQANVPDGTDPAIADAIRVGAQQAAVLNAAGKRLRLAVEDLPLDPVAQSAGERPSQVFGPFVEKSGRLLQFANYQSGAFLPVRVRFGILPIGEVMLLIPAASTTADRLTWNLVPGTIWMESRFLVAGATGFTGLRIAGGTLRFSSPAARIGNGIAVSPLVTWDLSVEPEPPPVPGADGSDEGGLALTLPSRLEVHKSGAPTASGDAALSGFGSGLHFKLSGPLFFEGHQISFPMTADAPDWSIAGNRSGLAQFSGTSTVGSPHWVLPISSTPSNLLAEASHGGSIVFALPSGITAMLATQQGGISRWFAATLTANAQRIELDATQADSEARYDDLELWNTSESSFHFARQPISRLLFRSERGGFDTVVIGGGAVRNTWDLPRRADGPPFPFDGTLSVFGIFSNAAGVWLTATATASVEDQSYGLALENLYLLVNAPQKMLVVASFTAPPLLASGIAQLFFNVNFGLPTLPDPYAANLGLPEVRGTSQQALRVVLAWSEGAEASLAVHLDRPIHFSEPRFLLDPDPDESFLYKSFQDLLGSQPEFLYLLDVSTSAHLFGVAIESPSDLQPQLIDNRLAFEASRIRLLMQPQVQWEPVQNDPNAQDKDKGFTAQILSSTMNGGPTLVGSNNVTLVPSLPAPVTEAILNAIKLDQRAAALFSLPFGLRAMARLSPPDPVFAAGIAPGAVTELHEPGFGDLSSARQIRITARNTLPPPQVDLSRYIPGFMRQLKNVNPAANQWKLSSVTPDGLAMRIPDDFKGKIPLHHADLSGYGLSAFSQWIDTGDGSRFSKVEFQVLNGRTAYEVLQYRSILCECGAYVVRTVLLERHNAGRVHRFDTGWVAVDAGTFSRPAGIEKGACLAFHNIRRIRITGDVFVVNPMAAFEPVIFDADAEIDGQPDLVPIYDRPGYVYFPPPAAPAPGSLTPPELAALFDHVGSIGSPVDCKTRIGRTLDMQLSSIVSDNAPTDAGGLGFAVAVVGTPALPHAGQWNTMRIDPFTHEVTPADPRRGVPVVRVGAGPFRFLEPSDARRTPHIQHGFLMATESSRVLFPQPFINSGAAGQIHFDLPPIMADPYSLVQSTAQFPRPQFALSLDKTALFTVTANNLWQIADSNFKIATPPLSDLLKGGDWGITRNYPNNPVQLLIDSAAPIAFNVGVDPSNLNLDLPAPLGSVMSITARYASAAGGLPALAKPDLVFKGALKDLTEVLSELSRLSGLPFQFDVSVTAGGGASPSFVVHLGLDFRIGRGPDERVDIGVGKFYGEFTVRGGLEAGVTGVGQELLLVDFRGDVQQGIIPPLLYAGGLFRFSIELHDTGSPVIQLTLGVVASIGGDLIPDLIELEVTVSYGYTLIPETLQPGVMLGLDARAKLLGGLVGFSFGVEAMARITRATPDHISIWAQIRVAGSVQVAYFIDEPVDFETQFQQDIPAAVLALAAGAELLAAATAV